MCVGVGIKQTSKPSPQVEIVKKVESDKVIQVRKERDKNGFYIVKLPGKKWAKYEPHSYKFMLGLHKDKKVELV